MNNPGFEINRDQRAQRRKKATRGIFYGICMLLTGVVASGSCWIGGFIYVFYKTGDNGKMTPAQLSEWMDPWIYGMIAFAGLALLGLVVLVASLTVRLCNAPRAQQPPPFPGKGKDV